MRLVNYIMAALFAYAVIVQLNDPDPIPWMLAYAGGVAFCLLFAMDEFPSTLGFVFAAACLLAGLVLLVRVFESNIWEWSERVNEPAGLLILFLWVSTLGWIDWKNKGVAPLS